jgi:hypothetical protein
MACGFQMDIPQAPTAGPTVTEDISIPVPDTSGTPILIIGFGAGELNIASGGDGLVSGTTTYNLPALKPNISTSGAVVKLNQGSTEGINTMPQDLENTWDLKIGSNPVDLQIEAGAYKARYDFGGLALTNLSIKDGASDVKVNFSAPNLATMALLRYETGASNVTLEGIGNASPASLVFKCGAGNYKLDFSGALAQNMTGHIEAGLGNITLVIPEGIPAQVTVEGGLSNISTGSGWTQNGNTYSQTGEGPALTILVDVGLGNLTLSR